MATKSRRAKVVTSTELTEGPPEGRTAVVMIKDDLTESQIDPETPTLKEEADQVMSEGMASMTAKVAELEAAMALLLPKVVQPKAPFDMSKNSMDRVNDWVNEFTTQEVMAYIESAAHEENEINGATLYAYRQRQAFEHKKALNDPTNCPGWFITISGNIRRDY